MEGTQEGSYYSAWIKGKWNALQMLSDGFNLWQRRADSEKNRLNVIWSLCSVTDSRAGEHFKNSTVAHQERLSVSAEGLNVQIPQQVLVEIHSSRTWDFVFFLWRLCRDWLSPSPVLWFVFHWCLNCVNHLFFGVLGHQINSWVLDACRPSNPLIQASGAFGSHVKRSAGIYGQVRRRIVF